MERDSFVFYRSFYEAIKELEDEDFVECMKMLCEYGLYGNEPTGSKVGSIAEVFFKMAKPQIDANNQRRNNGAKGGRPKTSGFESENHRLSGEKPNVNVNDNANVNDNGNVNVNVVDKPKRTPFKPPTLENVMGYCQEKGYRMDAERFIDYYTSNGWMVGRNKMKDWKSAVRNWVRKDNPPKQEETERVIQMDGELTIDDF